MAGGAVPATAFYHYSSSSTFSRAARRCLRGCHELGEDLRRPVLLKFRVPVSSLGLRIKSVVPPVYDGLGLKVYSVGFTV